MIASLDEATTDAFCRRARLRLTPSIYALPGTPAGAPADLARPFYAAPSLAARIQLLRPAYLLEWLPSICEPGDEDARATCLSADGACLDALARRLTLSVHVATRKLEALPDALQEAIRTGRPDLVENAITFPEVEEDVLARIRNRAAATAPRPELPGRIADLYAHWIIPLSRNIQVHGLLSASAV